MATKPNPKQQEIIQHIKFITHDLFVAQSHKKSPPKFTYKKTNPRTLSPQQTIRSCQCYHRIKSKVELPSSASPPKTGKPPIFTTFDQFWSDKQQKKTKRSPIIDKINKQVYGQFVKENKRKDLMQAKNNRDREQLWKDFLQRQGEWIEGKKQMIRHAQIVQQARLTYSPNQRRRKVATSAEHEWSEIEKGIRQLKHKTQELKYKVLKVHSKEKQRESRAVLVKTFQKSPQIK